jgi:hypothetical protein
MGEAERTKPAEMIKGEEAERFFKRYVKKILSELKECKVEDLIDAAKEQFYLDTQRTISQKALFGYYRSMRNPINGTLEEFQKDEESWVRIKKVSHAS